MKVERAVLLKQAVRLSRLLPFAAVVAMPFMEDWRLEVVLGTVLLVHASLIVRDIETARTAARRDKRLREVIRREGQRVHAEVRRANQVAVEQAERAQLRSERLSGRVSQQGVTLESLLASVENVTEQTEERRRMRVLQQTLMTRKLMDELDEGGMAQ